MGLQIDLTELFEPEDSRDRDRGHEVRVQLRRGDPQVDSRQRRASEVTE